MAVSTGWRLMQNIPPVVITTSASAEHATIGPGWFKIGVSGTPANILMPGAKAVLTKGTTTAAVDYAAYGTGIGGYNPFGPLLTVTALAASGILPLSVTTSGHDTIIQLGASSTSDQVAAAVNAQPASSKLVSATGHGAGTVIAFAKTALAFPDATAADVLYPVGIEDTPTWRDGYISALGTSAGGQVFAIQYAPC